MYETNARGILSSHWDTTIKGTGLEAMDFVNTKFGGIDDGLYKDATWETRVQLAHDTQTICGGFFFIAPRYWLEKDQTMAGIDNMTDDQHPIISFMRQHLANKEFYWMAFDAEDNSLLSNHGQVTDIWIKHNIADLVQRIQRQQGKGNMRPFKMGVYSRRSWIDDPAHPQKALEAYLGVQPDLFIYTANWPTGTGSTKSLAELAKVAIPAAHIPKAFGWCKDRPQTWQFWQAYGDSGLVYKSTDVLTQAGLPRPVCLELFNGDLNALKAWAGIGTVPPPPAEPPPDLTALANRVLALEREIAVIERPGAMTVTINKPQG